MARARDIQRERLYIAEKVLKDRSSRYETVPELQAYVDSVLATRWFRSRYPHIRYVLVQDGRSRRHAGAVVETNEILMPRWSRSTYVILHEIAHIVAERERSKLGEPWHGRTFVRVYLALVERFMGKEAAKALRASLREHRVKWNPRRPSFRPARPLGSVRS